MIQERILELVKYGLTTGLVNPEDKVYTINRLLELFAVDDIEDETFAKVENLSKYAKLQRKTAIPVTPVHTEHSDYSAPTG